ncbi:hypothetical protein [Actinomadura sp. 9N215]|uniref:hypothetical protein n=1 Tax=Actinomadura sp. 9N215 TaxID=3375150 RepID=UPI0037B9CE66
MRKRFIGPANPGRDEAGKPVPDLGHEINVRGRYLGNVKAGEVLDVPDELCAGTKDDPAPVWPQQLWEDVTGAPAKTKKGED